jgi:hypothetical protein
LDTNEKSDVRRQLIARGNPIEASGREPVPEVVSRYIREHALYNST